MSVVDLRNNLDCVKSSRKVFTTTRYCTSEMSRARLTQSASYLKVNNSSEIRKLSTGGYEKADKVKPFF